MPIRILRPGINDSDRVDALSDGAEILYRRLMSVVDDFGRFEADLRKIRSQCWPKKFDLIQGAQVEEWLAECCEGDNPLILLYEVGGKKYIQIENFGQRIRKDKDGNVIPGKYPDPPKSDLRSHAEVRGEAPQGAARASTPTTSPTTPSTSSSTGECREPKPAPTKALVLVGRSRFEEFWALWSSARGSAHRGAAADQWLSVVTPALEKPAIECAQSYLQAGIPTNKGYRPDNFLREMAVDSFTARWVAPAPARASPAQTLREEQTQIFRKRLIEEMAGKWPINLPKRI